MSGTEYKALRQQLGDQKKVAAALGIDRRTIQRREYGIFKITYEAEIAIRHLFATAGLRAIPSEKS